MLDILLYPIQNIGQPWAIKQVRFFKEIFLLLILRTKIKIGYLAQLDLSPFWVGSETTRGVTNVRDQT